MNRTGKFAAIVALFGAVFALPGQAHAVLGGTIFANGGPVTVEILPNDAGFISELFLFPPAEDPAKFIALNTSTGVVIPVGTYAAGTELIFGIVVHDTSIDPDPTYKTGPASRNPDGIIHADVTVIDATTALVGFEDLAASNPSIDFDYNDTVFRFVGVSAPDGVVPEPGSLALMGLGIAGFAARRRRKSAAKV